MKKSGKVHKWPSVDDPSTGSSESLLCVMNTPTLINSHGQSGFSDECLNKAREMCEMYNGKKCGLQVDEFQPG
jgi:hypothetical protein